MQTLRQTLQIFLPLVVGIGLLVGLSKIPALVNFEHALFWDPSNYATVPGYTNHGTPEEFEVEFYRQNIFALVHEGTTHQIAPATEDILGSAPLQPSNWAYLLSQLKPEKSQLLVITNELSWDNAEEIPIRALQHEISRFPASVIGLACEKTGEDAPIPTYLESSVVSEFHGFPANLPEVDLVIAPPSVNPTYFGISTIRGMKDESGKVPLLVKWGNQILPTVELAALLAEFKIAPSEIVIDPAGLLRLNREGPLFLKIDSEGRTVAESGGKPVSASELLISPAELRHSYHFVDQDAPKRLSGLALTFSFLAMNGQHVSAKFERWPLVIETSFLILLTLSFATQRLWPAILLVLIGYLASFLFLGKWFVLSPVIALLAIYLIFIRQKRPK